MLWPLEASLSDSSLPCEKAPAPLLRAPVLWKDWPRCGIRRAWLKVVRSQTVWVESSTRPEPSPVPPPTEEVLTRAERAHWRLSWDQRLARTSRPSDAPGQITGVAESIHISTSSIFPLFLLLYYITFHTASDTISQPIVKESASLAFPQFSCY